MYTDLVKGDMSRTRRIGRGMVVLRGSAHDGALHEEGVACDLNELDEVVVVVGGVKLEEARVDRAHEHLDALLHQRLHEAQPQVHLCLAVKKVDGNQVDA